MGESKYSMYDLEGRSYRELQQLAKSLGLSANVKKVYLIELIHAKIYKSATEVKSIVYRVKLERQQRSMIKKYITRQTRRLQSIAISPSNNCPSKSINNIPKGSGHLAIQYNPNICQTIMKHTRPNLLRSSYVKKTCSALKTIESSDRVLRSFNVKSKNFGTQHCGSMQKPRPDTSNNKPKQQKVTVQNTLNSMPTLPAKRQKILSRIHPLDTKEKYCKVNYDSYRSDGTLSKINAFVQKTNKPNKSIKYIDLTVQDLINSNVDSQNMSSEYNIQETVSSYPDRTNVNYTPSRNQRPIDSKCFYGDEQLPRIGKVFSLYEAGTENNLPINKQVSAESERMLNIPLFVSNASSTSMMETLYDYKNQFLVNQPLHQTSKKAETKCVFATQIDTSSCEGFIFRLAYTSRICTAFRKVQASTATNSACNISHLICPSPSPNSSNRASEAPIPEMIEDELEIISLDGDYLERIGMDGTMQCILCSWAGPRNILENHIRNEHPNEIHKQEQSKWSVLLSVGRLIRNQLWSSHVAEHGDALYVLSTKYEKPHWLLCTLTMLSSDSKAKVGSITVHNKVTGDLISWTGNIKILPPTLPHHVDRVCLKQQIIDLNLIPNSANLNRELFNSPGNPDLTDIQIMLSVKILN